MPRISAKIDTENVFFSLIIAFLFLLHGCTTQEPLGVVEGMDVQAAQIAIDNESAFAANESAIERLIALHNTVLASEPDNKKSLSALAQLHTLLGAAFIDSRSQKRYHYRMAKSYAEKIMFLNTDFAQRVSDGEAVWEASDALTKAEADGLGWWSTAMLYYYKEGVPDVLKIVNYRLVKRSKIMMDRLSAVDPVWENGTNYFNLAIYYHALPEIAGGDFERSQQLMQKAQEVGPNRLLIPWGKAAYFYPNRMSGDAYRSALHQVLAQDITQESGEIYAWRVYFQEQSRLMLDAES